ncbi:MAG: nitrate reductase molybdenum cofactor assembly chaperone [Terriglobales bacterium]
MNAEIYNSLATLLSYPDGRTFRTCHPECGEGPAGAEVALFHESVRSLDLRQVQELFIGTFDLSPVCSLEMGWHLFGENYDRGLLLVKIRALLRKHAIAESTELPDHLTYALRLVPRMEAAEAEYFVEAIVLPAIAKMLSAFEGKKNPYEHVLDAVRNTLAADFSGIQFSTAAAGAELRVLA